MSSKAFALAFLAGVLFLASPTAVAQGEAGLPAEADRACRDLFKMLDQGRLKESYTLTAPLVKKTQNENGWYGYLLSERESMGQVKSRRLAKVERVEKFADLPKGKYLKAVFATVFSTQPESEEIVVLLPAQGGGYGVAGYKIEYNRWPEARDIIINGLLIVFFIMVLLSFLTWAVGRVIQWYEQKHPAEEKG